MQIYGQSLEKICVWSGHNEFVARYTVFFQEHFYQLLTKGCLTRRQMLNEQECPTWKPFIEDNILLHAVGLKTWCGWRCCGVYCEESEQCLVDGRWRNDYLTWKQPWKCIQTANYYCCNLPACSWSHCASLAYISFCGVATDASNRLAVKVFPVLIHYLNWKDVECRQLFNIYSKPNDVRLPAAKLWCIASQKIGYLH